jgi:hypothetical protein
VLPLKAREGLAKHFRLGTGHALREPCESRVPVPCLCQRGQHQLGHVGLAGRGRAVPPGAAVPFPAREPFFRQPVKHSHHCGVSQALWEPVADLSYGQRRISLPEDFHNGTFEVAQPVHEDKSTVGAVSVASPEVSAASGDFAICTQPTMIAPSAMICGTSHQPSRRVSLKSVTP